MDATFIDDPREYAPFTRWRAQTGGDALAESSLRVSGMTCATCALTVEAALNALPGVRESSVSSVSGLARVRWDPSLSRPSQWLTAISRAGYSAVPDTAAAAREQRRAEARLMLWRLFVAAFCSMQIMMLATPSYVSAPGEMAPDLARLLAIASWLLCLPVLLFSAAPFFLGAWAGLRQSRISMDLPVALGVATAFVASTGAAFDPGGPFGSAVYFDSLTMFLSFLLASRLLEMKARHRAAAQLEDSLLRLPEAVQRVRADGSLDSVSVHALQPGDRVRVALGQAFAADGVLLTGPTRADEALLTGESRPVAKQAGDEVVAGSVNLGVPVEMRVERVGADTRYEAIAALMRDALSQRPDLSRAADRWAGPFLFAVLLLAAAAALIWTWIDPARSVYVFVSVLIVTCPCALSLAVPSALLSSASRLAREGVLLRRLDALERLARVDRLLVDKTGTVTQTGQAAVTLRTVGVQSESAERLRTIAAALANWSRHPTALALADSTQSLPWRSLREVPGSGMEGVDDQGRVWRLGSAAWVAAADEVADGQTFLSCDGQVQARFDFEEQLREDSVLALQELRGLGLQISLLSGDSEARTLALSTRLGLNSPRGGLSPEDKLAAVREAQAQGHLVAMVGDGVNDAPVLAQADLSVAMGEGAAIARSHADVVLLGNSLRGVATARVLARRAMRVIRQNLAWAALYNAACIPLALAGLLPPLAAGLGMAASSLFVVLNSLRLAR